MRGRELLIVCGALVALPSAPKGQGLQPHDQYWYYCDEAKAYYPYVTTCPGTWRPVNILQEQARQRDEAQKKAEAAENARELAAAKAGGFKTVEEYRAAQEAQRQKEQEQAQATAAEAERERQARADEQTAVAAGYSNVDAYHAAMAEKAHLQQVAVNASYDDLARNPTRHAGQVIHLAGRVVQVLYNGSDVTLRVNVTPNMFGWTDTVLCTYHTISTTEPRILEGDLIEMWGISEGITSYQAILSQTIQLPQITIRYFNHLGSI